MSKPQRQCIFCDNPANSKEHVWSEWMHPFLGGDPDDKYYRHTFTSWPDGREEKSGPASKPGNIYKLQIRQVCHTCNNGWMNRIEGQTRPFFDEMIQGNPVTLDASQIEALAKWCALKFIVMEHASKAVDVTPREDRVAFRLQGRIPPYFRIYLGNHNLTSRAGSRRSSRCMAKSLEGPSPPLLDAANNIQTTTVILGRLFVHLNAARVDDFEIETTYWVSRVWEECQIWPRIPHTRTWPCRPLLGKDGLRMISNSLERIFSSPTIIWLESFPKD